MAEISVRILDTQFTIRENTQDYNIVHDVVICDEYMLKTMSGFGYRPNLIVDIGGHIGGFVAAASIQWPGATILSFEPYLPNYRLLAKNIAQFPHAVALNFAVVGDAQTSEMKYQYDPDQNNTGIGCLCADGNISVPAISVDKLLDITNSLKIDLLKLDCEGSELSILNALAAKNVLSGIGLICGEWHGGDVKKEIEEILRPSHNFLNITHDQSVHDVGLFFAEPAVRSGFQSS